MKRYRSAAPRAVGSAGVATACAAVQVRSPRRRMTALDDLPAIEGKLDPALGPIVLPRGPVCDRSVDATGGIQFVEPALSADA